jgi:hypothetical protein
LQVPSEPVQAEYIRQLVHARPALEDQLASRCSGLARARRICAVAGREGIDESPKPDVCAMFDSETHHMHSANGVRRYILEADLFQAQSSCHRWSVCQPPLSVFATAGVIQSGRQVIDAAGASDAERLPFRSLTELIPSGGGSLRSGGRGRRGLDRCGRSARGRPVSDEEALIAHDAAVRPVSFLGSIGCCG